jgi:probable F420-dependent oxidoreductase
VRCWLPLIHEPVEQYLDVARHAEACGFEGIALADHVAVPETFASVHPSGENPFTAASPFPDTFTSMAAMAAVTTRLRLLSYVYVLPAREPFSVAKQAGTVALLSGGRVVLGVGAGWLQEELQVLGVDPRTRGRRMDEMLTVIGDLWDDGWAEHHGEHFDFDRVGMFPAPGPLAPPVWVGGSSDAALRRAARADGWLGMNHGVDEIEGIVGRLRELRGGSLEGFEVFVIANAAPSPELYARLAGLGVTATMLMPWVPGDPAFLDLDRKRAAMEQAAEAFGLA